MTAGNKSVDAAANLALRDLRLDRGDACTATTIFTCKQLIRPPGDNREP